MEEKSVKNLIRDYEGKLVTITFDIFSDDKISQEVMFTFADRSEYGIISIQGVFDMFLDALYEELLAGELSSIFEVSNCSGKPFGNFSVTFSARGGCQINSDQISSPEEPLNVYFGKFLSERIAKVPEFNIQTYFVEDRNV